MESALETADTVRAARDRHTAEGGAMVVDYDRFWARARFEGIEVPFPNPPAHGRALRCHDLHHVITGFGTDAVGETELAAWELGGGVGRYVAAFGFDLAGTALGLVLAPRRTFRAFVRGRRGTNLFREGFRKSVLDEPIADVRSRFGLGGRTPEPAARASDYAAFALYCSLGIPWVLGAPISALVLAATCLAPAPREDWNP